MNYLKKSLLAGVAVASGAATFGFDITLGKQKVEFHGFGSQGFLYSSDYEYLGNTREGSFEFSEVGLNATINPFNRTRISAQGFLFDLGDSGNYKPMLDYALIDYNFSSVIGVRGGRIRRPAGIYNHIQDVDLSRTSILLPQGIYDARWRDFSSSVDGVSVYGNIGLRKAGGLSYEIYSGFISLADDGGVAQMIEDGLWRNTGQFIRVEDLGSSLLTGGQLWYQPPVDGLRFGFSAGYADGIEYAFNVPTPFGSMRTENEINSFFYQISAEYLWKNWTFQAEYQTLNNFSEQTVMGTTSESRGRGDSWYVGAAYRVNKWFEVGSYYSEYYGNVDDRDGTKGSVGAFGSSSDAYQRDLALSTRFDIKDWWIVKLEGHHINGTAHVFNRNGENPRQDGGAWWMFAAKTTFSF